VNGRLGAAETLVNEMSIETISAIKTQYHCGYPFNFMDPGTEHQDQDEVAHAAREHLSSSGRQSLRPSDIPSAADHKHNVLQLRQAGKTYYELQQLVRLVALFREWREEEDNLIKSVIYFFHSRFSSLPVDEQWTLI
jgi:nuclear pore complex protein Nup107